MTPKPPATSRRSHRARRVAFVTATLIGFLAVAGSLAFGGSISSLFRPTGGPVLIHGKTVAGQVWRVKVRRTTPNDPGDFSWCGDISVLSHGKPVDRTATCGAPSEKHPLDGVLSVDCATSETLILGAVPRRATRVDIQASRPLKVRLVDGKNATGHPLRFFAATALLSDVDPALAIEVSLQGKPITPYRLPARSDLCSSKSGRAFGPLAPD
jgi:hypothetical protein